MPRSIWSGVISFGVVSIPVKLYAATESKDVSFRLLHKECHGRLKQLRWCPPCERAVEWAETVRGYEYARDEHVVMSEDDFEKLPLASKQTIELSGFVGAGEIDPVFYEKSYYLEPEKLGEKPFALLMRALAEKGLTAVAQIAIRHKERLCALRPLYGTLMLQTLFYPDEIRVQRDAEVPKVQLSEQELTMAFTLIELLSEPFHPAGYRDEYREALMRVIEAKLQGQELLESPPAPRGAVDLTSALRASVEAAKKQRVPTTRPPSRQRAPAA
jgi:DNA end-binding protein Ku